MATRITYRASTSYESDTQPVLTDRREIVAANGAQAARRAAEAARRAFPGTRPRSIVIVLEEISRGDVPSPRKALAKATGEAA